MNNTELTKEIELLKTQVAELLDWKTKRIAQQITLPLDIPSKNILTTGSITQTGTTSAGNTTVYNAFPVTVPANPTGCLTVVAKGITYNLLYK